MRSGGRHLFGLAAICFGLGTLVRHDFIAQVEPPGAFPQVGLVIAAVGVAALLGGTALQTRRYQRVGAAVLALLYAMFTALWLPQWLRDPAVFDPLGNAFEQFAMVSGALILFGASTARIGYVGFALSVISFALYQAIRPHFTAQLVPAWIPPGQMFWLVVTTLAFALAAIALLTGRAALPAARMTALMIAGFGVTIWVPAVFANPHSLPDWSELILNFGICGSAWIVADDLAGRQA